MKKRLLELDLLRGIAFFLVVIQHTLGGYSYSKNISITNLLVSRFIYIIALPAVKIFLTLMAISLIYTYLNKFNFKKFYIKKIKFLLIPYIIFSFLNIILLRDTYKLKSFIAQILTGNSAYHLWYMAMTLRIYIYFPLIVLLVKKINKKNKYFKILFLIFYTIMYLFILINNSKLTSFIGKLIFKNPSYLQQKFINVSPLPWSLYFVIGIYIILNYTSFKNFILKFKRSLIILYIITLCLVYINEISNIIHTPLLFTKFNNEISIINNILSIIFFCLSSIYILNTKKRLSKVIKFMGDFSFPAYMFHIVILQYLANHIPQTKNLYSPIILLVLTIIITLSIIYIFSFLPYSNYILGIKSNFKNKEILK